MCRPRRRLAALVVLLTACRAPSATSEASVPAALADQASPSEADASTIVEGSPSTELRASATPEEAAPPGPSTLAAEAPPPANASPRPQACCKTCRKGKACGDTCIAADRICEHPPGCACDASAEGP